MTKTKITLAAIGGAGLLAALGAAAFAFVAFDSKATCEEELSDSIEEARRYLKAEIPPCAEAKAAIDDSCEQVKIWREEAFRLAAHGDRPVEAMTSAQLKEFAVANWRRLKTFPIDAAQKVVEDDFVPGPFKPYVLEGKMPDEKELLDLQRKFDDIALIIEMMAQCGVTPITGLDLDDRTEATKVDEAKPLRGRKSQQPAKKAVQKKAANETDTFKPASHTYRVICKTTPNAFVKTLNAFATCERYVVIEDFTLAPVNDTIQNVLGGGEAKKEEAPTSRRGRRRQAAAEEEKAAEGESAEAPKVTPVTDPATDAVFEAVLTVTVHDFKTLESAPKEEEEAK